MVNKDDSNEWNQGWERVVKAFRGATAKVEFGEDVRFYTILLPMTEYS